MLEAIRYQRGSLELLEQRELPLVTRYVPIAGTADAWRAIRDMTVRGAPAIAIAAMLALAVELYNGGNGSQYNDALDAIASIDRLLLYLVSSRPTAVNLAQAADEMRDLMRQAGSRENTTANTVVEAVIDAAELMLEADVKANKALGRAGAEAVLRAVSARRAQEGESVFDVKLLTHCNTGSLATAGYGTALGVARALHDMGRLAHVTCTETRPYNQGARLTAYELVHDGLPATLIVDSAAAARMAAGEVDAVVVGADRVAANGDTANKIGTYSLALAAAGHGIPFFVAAPTTTLDPATPCGGEILIEQRDPREITHVLGRQVTPDGIEIWNPSFDVTPAKLIEGIITERGVCYKEQSGDTASRIGFDIVNFLKHPVQQRELNGIGLSDDADLHAITNHVMEPLGIEGVREYVSARPELYRLVGSPSTASQWDVREVGDGNINFVYLVDHRGANGKLLGSLCLKQSLPFVRMVGPDWPLSQARLAIEVEALRTEARLCPEHVPAVHLFDPGHALVAMDRIPPPHTILRGALIHGEIFPYLGAHVADFLAKTLYYTSYIHLGAAKFRDQVAKFDNRDMCDLTEQVIFTDPYYAAPHNRALSDAPHLEPIIVQQLRTTEARQAVTEAKRWFMYEPQALLHGDFHTGSLMVTKDSTYAIDAEFAFCGPIGFELGKWVGNLFLAFFGAPGHGLGTKRQIEQQTWLLDAAHESWHGFLKKFAELYAQDSLTQEGEEELAADNGSGTLLSAPLFDSPAARRSALDSVLLQEVVRQAAIFAGVVIIRRIVGLARVADLEKIPDAAIKAAQEKSALEFGIRLLHGLPFEKALEELRSSLTVL